LKHDWIAVSFLDIALEKNTGGFVFFLPVFYDLGEMAKRFSSLPCEEGRQGHTPAMIYDNAEWNDIGCGTWAVSLLGGCPLELPLYTLFLLCYS
jgi:hypothetical protein